MLCRMASWLDSGKTGCPMGEQADDQAGPSRLNELAKTVANCQSTGTSQAQQSRQHKHDFDLDLQIYRAAPLVAILRVCCRSVA